MKRHILAGTALMVMLGSPLAAQEVRYGIAVSLDAPTGAFNNTTYGNTYPSNGPTTVSYNSGAGVDFWICQDLNRTVGLRYNLGFATFTGTSNAPDSGYGAFSLNTQDQMFTLGMAGQFFVAGGDAGRQSGTYLLAGLSVDFENFNASFGDPNYDPTSSVNKTRLAGTVGIGHTFRSRWGGRYVLEGAYHKTLTADNTASGDQAAADFLKFTFGFIF